MIKQISSILLFAFASLWASEANAQVTQADYERADSIVKLNDLVYHQVKQLRWVDSSSSFWYNTKTKSGLQYFLVDAEKASRKSLFETEKLVQQLNEKTGKALKADQLDLSRLELDPKAKQIHFVFDKAYWTLSLKNEALNKDSVVAEPKPEQHWANKFDELGNDPVSSPDGAWTAYIKNYNVFVKDAKTQAETQLSFDGSAGDFYSSYLSWSPDSKKLAVNRVRDNADHYIYFVESSPASQLQPILHKQYYLKPGDALPIKRPALFDVESKTQIPLDTEAFENQYDLTYPEWRKNSSAFTFEFNQRGHQVYQVVKVDAATGKMTVIVDERSKTFIDYSGKRYRHDLEETGELIWASERDGWNHLYLVDANTGVLKKQITKGEWVVRKVVHVDAEKRQILFEASGKNEGEDPYLIHCYRVNFDGSGLQDLTPEKQNHDLSFSADFNYFVDTYSTVETAPTTVLKKTSDGSVILELEKADITGLLAKGWVAPEPFVAKARDGKTDIWGNIYRPVNFDPTKTYPIVEYIYAGPQDSFTQKSFYAVSSRFAGLAELGFIVVQMDGMGTSNRGKAFHDVCWKNLKDAGFPDRILWMKAAAERYSYMDTTRVGIFGGSAGGQNTLTGLLFHPEFYKAGSSSCGCHDNRMDKMWWNEQWMGYPIGPQYAECSNVENAYRLKGDLLLIVGEVDDNVDPASTMQVVNALIKAKKNFDLVVLPGTNHTLGGEFGEMKRRDFFVRTLLKQEPPKHNN
ncbi:S9 family peptidase [Mangrovibacterium marinum]|uniref:Dipeptidyl aminopeptidase/acylaminoacyl peptidase n=1 Tax=Mangrovibacterium marinum TaxID=1639118 RepID=A0A2T5BYV6_9BACT|nr:S9 family peptidase [Mangrovibacterium marinum]PTN07438.1 dipeptidyl aminopeptidase/acylaminoacyl peptidase [Mangrovibacterium marinum]